MDPIDFGLLFAQNVLKEKSFRSVRIIIDVDPV
jgi:hypothetical protein